jgi:hypothetical protein
MIYKRLWFLKLFLCLSLPIFASPFIAQKEKATHYVAAYLSNAKKNHYLVTEDGACWKVYESLFSKLPQWTANDPIEIYPNSFPNNFFAAYYAKNLNNQEIIYINLSLGPRRLSDSTYEIDEIYCQDSLIILKNQQNCRSFYTVHANDKYKLTELDVTDKIVSISQNDAAFPYLLIQSEKNLSFSAK